MLKKVILLLVLLLLTVQKVSQYVNQLKYLSKCFGQLREKADRRCSEEEERGEEVKLGRERGRSLVAAWLKLRITKKVKCGHQFRRQATV